jgi:N,N-dimethylformamidase
VRAPRDAVLRLGGLTLAANLTPKGPAGHFDGRLENPRILDRSPATDPTGADHIIHTLDDLAPTVDRDLAEGMDTNEFLDVSAKGLHGTFHPQPSRAVTGHLWTGEHHDPCDEPTQWAAVLFHSDDPADANWSTDFTVNLPTAMPSGVYAARIEQGTDVEEIPFYVTAPPGRRADILFLAPTNTYLAYGNEHLAHRAGGRRHESMMAGPI